MLTRQDRLRGGLIGLLVGDALGVPYEFSEPDILPPETEIEYAPPVGFRRAHVGVPPGTWSDDGAQALCLLASLLERGRLDVEDVGQRLLRWYDEGYLAVDGVVFDVGTQTHRALEALRAGTPAGEAGSREESALGNGSLMRALPLALWHRGTDAELVADAQAQSRVTHGHARAQVCCAVYCLWARYTLEQAEQPWPEACGVLRALWAEDTTERVELERAVRPDEAPAGNGRGYVVDCLHSARWALGAGNYEAVVRAAIGLGHDTDTSACVAGGIAGLRDSHEAIPARWRGGLRGEELYAPLLRALLDR